jgi:hypothetical protein
MIEEAKKILRGRYGNFKEGQVNERNGFLCLQSEECFKEKKDVNHMLTPQETEGVGEQVETPYSQVG